MDELRVHGDRLRVHVFPVFSTSFPVALVVERMCVYITTEKWQQRMGNPLAIWKRTPPHPCLPLSKKQTLFLD